MNRQVYFRPEAADESIDAGEWYEARRPGLGREFADALKEVVSRIAHDPLLFPAALGEVRRAVLNRFPYAVYFRISDEDIVVLAVHGRQDPRTWQQRTSDQELPE